MTRSIILFLAMLLMPFVTVSAQGTRVIYGQTQTLNDLPVSGISITAKNSKAKTLSDSLGNFAIVCQQNDRLKFKAKVFNNKTVKIKPNSSDTINVSLRFINSERNVDVAIGYGYIKEKHRTQAIQYIDSKVDYSSYTNIYEVLRNNFPNLQISRDGCVVIRGPSSVNTDNCAIFVVDGSKTDKIDYIAPAFIKDISVLKDASSAAIYGCESTNGVILINLVRGEVK